MLYVDKQIFCECCMATQNSLPEDGLKRTECKCHAFVNMENVVNWFCINYLSPRTETKLELDLYLVMVKQYPKYQIFICNNDEKKVF